MSTLRLTRRRFLAAGLALGAGTLVLSGLPLEDTSLQPKALPDWTTGGDNMSSRILVAYASRTGSTAGVAEAIGRTLAEGGNHVDVRPMTEVTDLTAYRAVVAGSAIQSGAWLPEAMEFMHRHRQDLSRRPFAAFLVCMTMSMNNPQHRQGVAAWLDPVRALVRPASEGLFAGCLDTSKIPSFGDRLKFRLSIRLGFWSEGDHRDWPAIHAWSTALRPRLLA